MQPLAEPCTLVQRLFFYKILTYVCLYLFVYMLESVGSGLKLPRLNPAPPLPRLSGSVASGQSPATPQWAAHGPAELRCRPLPSDCPPPPGGCPRSSGWSALRGLPWPQPSSGPFPTLVTSTIQTSPLHPAFTGAVCSPWSALSLPALPFFTSPLKFLFLGRLCLLLAPVPCPRRRRPPHCPEVPCPLVGSLSEAVGSVRAGTHPAPLGPRGQHRTASFVNKPLSLPAFGG